MNQCEKLWKQLSKINKYDKKLLSIKYNYMVHVSDEEEKAQNFFGKIFSEMYNLKVKSRDHQSLKTCLFDKATAIFYISLEKQDFGKIYQCNRNAYEVTGYP